MSYFFSLFFLVILKGPHSRLVPAPPPLLHPGVSSSSALGDPTARQAATSAALTTVPLAACFQVNSRPLPPISSRSPDRSRSIHPSTTLSRSGPSGQTILISSTEST
ncbi:hypothetical protein AX14_001095 [Amanita brunnescens Koide BX004]|nr:hypothetical protein AX14_001095 [Amanita brunnescens Koide BX004]